MTDTPTDATATPAADAAAAPVAPATASVPLAVSAIVKDDGGRVGVIVGHSPDGFPLVAFLGDAVECVVPVIALA